MSLDVELYVEVDTGASELHRVCLYDANITHNLCKMAEAAGIYEIVWHPESLGIKRAYEIIQGLETGIDELKSCPSVYKAFDAENGWGLYADFVPWLDRYLEACKEHPLAKIYSST